MSDGLVIDEEQFVDEVAELVKKIQTISFNNEADLAGVILTAMSFMSTFTKISGSSKKEIVVEALKQVVEEQDIFDESTKMLLLNLISIAAPRIIDVIYEAANTKLIFNSKGLCCCSSARARPTK